MGLPLVAFLARALEVDVARVQPLVASSGILHAVFSLTPAEHEAWRARPVSVPEGPELEAAFRAAIDAREGLLARLQRLSYQSP
jgi:hypothetical protein